MYVYDFNIKLASIFVKKVSLLKIVVVRLTSPSVFRTFSKSYGASRSPVVDTVLTFFSERSLAASLRFLALAKSSCFNLSMSSSHGFSPQF